jgi:hypothetical protein
VVAVVMVALAMRMKAVNQASGGATYSRRQLILPTVLGLILIVLGQLIRNRI